MDATSFCDPKVNVAGEPEINHWANSADIQTAGNINYAPFAGNSRFFDKYYRDILVINGVDAQTNSHSVGVVNNWSARNSGGFPSITALMAASSAPELPLAYLNFGGFGNTQSIIRSSRIDNIEQLRNIIFPNNQPDDPGTPYRRESDWQRIQALQLQNQRLLVRETALTAGARNNRRFYLDALERTESLKAFGNLIPNADKIQQKRRVNIERESSLHQQIQVTLLANATDAIDYLWTSAEQLGLADRIVLIIGSDFGRTPHYNSGGGKDHWPIGGTLIMERNARYTNRVVGETDAGHNTLNINPQTLRQDNMNGVIIRPSHVHKALRAYLGIGSNSIASQFAFNNIEDFAFFA